MLTARLLSTAIIGAATIDSSCVSPRLPRRLGVSAVSCLFPVLFHLLLISCPAFSQTFEVASVKVSQASPDAPKGNRGLKSSIGSVTIQNMPLAPIVRWAYGVKDFQVDGPQWTNVQGYDIFAKAAGPAKDPELQVMMQHLLEERFKLVVHREIRELPVYEMTIAKGGS
jgi:hypothetical protein